MQWQQGYPNINTMKNDINNGNLFGVYEDNKLIGIEALVIGIEPSYIEIFDGTWTKETSDKDLVIHRIAVKEEYHKRKVGDFMIKYAIEYAKNNDCISIKADTHTLNKAMQYLLVSNKFEYRGIIYLHRDEVDNSRIAYELAF